MNILFLSLLYHPDAIREVSALSLAGLQNQASGYQWAIIDGIKCNLREGETLSILNSLPVGNYPKQYRKLFIRGKTIDDHFIEISSINLPICKQKIREHAAERQIEHWVEKSDKNRVIVLYSLYLPYLRAITAVKERHVDLKACVIVTDLPGRLGLQSGRQGLLKIIEYRMGRQSLHLSTQMNGFILLTEQMTEPLLVGDKNYCIIEGLSAEQSVSSEIIDFPADERPAVLYTGTLNREVGIGYLLKAFEQMHAYQLWLCGKGDMEGTIIDMQNKHDNIHYFGFVSHAQAIYLQSKASVLINPRTNQGIYTQYSFPSKTMEYMRSGKPVLCCQLDGIPAEYDDYLMYIKPQNAQGISISVQTMMGYTQQERDEIGRLAREFVVSKKNNIVQGKKALDLLRSL